MHAYCLPDLQVQQSHRILEQEHLLLQQKLSSVTATAETDKEGNRELLFRLSYVKQELPKFKVALAHHKDESRQLQDNNSRLTRVSPSRSCTLTPVLCCTWALHLHAQQLLLQI